MSTPFLSICIPSYNRPGELQNLLASIDCNPAEGGVISCVDLAPKVIYKCEKKNIFSKFTVRKINIFDFIRCPTYHSKRLSALATTTVF